MEISVVYKGQPNTGMFTNIFLHREEFGKSFAYDGNKNLVAAEDLVGMKSGMQYDKYHNLTKYRKPGRPKEEQYSLNYGKTDKKKDINEPKQHLVRSMTTPESLQQTFTYDKYGNQLTARTKKKGGKFFIETQTEYSRGNYATKKIDARGKSMTMKVDSSTGRLSSATDAKGTTVDYRYDGLGRLRTASCTDGVKKYLNRYTYEENRLKKIAHNTETNTPDVVYTFDYDALGAVTKVSVGDGVDENSQTVLSKNTYSADRYHLLTESEYMTDKDGLDNPKVRFTYDDFNRPLSTTYGNTRYTYSYDANGKVSKVRFEKLNGAGAEITGRTRIYETEYDLALRPRRSRLTNRNGKPIYEATLLYDKYGRLDVFEEEVGRSEYTSDYTYDKDDRIKKVQYGSAKAKRYVEYKYDEVGRVGLRTTSNGENSWGAEYQFIAGGHGANSTTPLVASISQSGENYVYDYDPVGNIRSETRNGNTTTGYRYDKLGQLIRVNDQRAGETWLYTYDRGGNIKKKRKYAYTTESLTGKEVLDTISYTYDTGWRDKLAAYDGKTIGYDDIGNPTTYDGWTYTWENGRQLAQAEKGATTIQYEYDHTGLRTAKTVNGTRTEYILHGKLIMELKRGNDSLHFFYNASSNPAMVRMDGKYYTFRTNLQGDVVAIVDNENRRVVRYSYDAWGKPRNPTFQDVDLDIDDKYTQEQQNEVKLLATLNPFRYRGYVWDEETGLYYLRSRYYNPEWGRFINADATLGGSHRPLVNNVFTYCINNPVIHSDPSGYFPKLAALIAGVVVAAGVVLWRRLSPEWFRRNDAERAWAVNHPLSISTARKHEATVIEVTDRTFPSNVDGTYANAFRHMYLSALLSRDLGYDVAIELMTAHESVQLTNGDRPYTPRGSSVASTEGAHAQMDLINNEFGANIGTNYKGASDAELAFAVDIFLRNEVINHGYGGPENGSRVYIIEDNETMLHCTHRWEATK